MHKGYVTIDGMKCLATLKGLRTIVLVILELLANHS